jgi:hypothetical protein
MNETMAHQTPCGAWVRGARPGGNDRFVAPVGLSTAAPHTPVTPHPDHPTPRGLRQGRARRCRLSGSPHPTRLPGPDGQPRPR